MLGLNPRSTAARYRRGYCFQTQGAIDTAVSEYTQAIKLDPAHGDAYHGRGYCRCLRGQYAESVRDLSEALRLGLQYRDIYYCARSRAQSGS